ncbi:hypothetical protein E5288_WYG010372 [Bos mutus]|uniref:Uncharacterized protein n=1 Tax=Bos mutus TaxID=72004 RepID=A0A6B0RVL9_9CETA|nr:hypothetical protein [Bos mutus]
MRRDCVSPRGTSGPAGAASASHPGHGAAKDVVENPGLWVSESRRFVSRGPPGPSSRDRASPRRRRVVCGELPLTAHPTQPRGWIPVPTEEREDFRQTWTLLRFQPLPSARAHQTGLITNAPASRGFTVPTEPRERSPPPRPGGRSAAASSAFLCKGSRHLPPGTVCAVQQTLSSWLRASRPARLLQTFPA